jgi:hypothetical protein
MVALHQSLPAEQLRGEIMQLDDHVARELAESTQQLLDEVQRSTVALELTIARTQRVIDATSRMINEKLPLNPEDLAHSRIA